MEDTDQELNSKKTNKLVKKTEKTKKPRDKKKIACITTLIIGIIVLVAGAVFLVLKLTSQSAVADGEYLVSKGKWALEIKADENTKCSKSEEGEEKESKCVPMHSTGAVVWNFTEVGKGSLTTDSGEHNYDFIWAIEDGKLLIETNWLYDIDNEYEYSLDQRNNVLTLKADDQEYTFVVQQ